MNELQVWYAVGVIALVTAGIRFLPFAVFRGEKQTPPMVEKLGRVLPYAIMGMLVVYCLKCVSFAAVGDWLPSVIASAVTVGLYVWKRNTLVSIIAGTVCYMLLVQMIF
ncbi:MAG: AzlD domain-containing protein [Oscillospiraceae bacterium]|nr:AzlD domain-containing protein [Oscillospiraceae bacterium]